NTFTLNPGWTVPWSATDRQHTMMGILWTFTGSISLTLSTKFTKQISNILPALTILLTGFAFAGHSQHSVLSAGVHKVVGWSLVIAAVSRGFTVILMHNKSKVIRIPHSEFIFSLFLVISGVLFISANWDFMEYYSAPQISMDHITYSMGAASVAFAIILYILISVVLYGIFKGKGNQKDLQNEEASEVSELELGLLNNREDIDL
ncbi:hypothetical protein HK096_005087, partial [Nowakowskiella sp. JEL0078]